MKIRKVPIKWNLDFEYAQMESHLVCPKQHYFKEERPKLRLEFSPKDNSLLLCCDACKDLVWKVYWSKLFVCGLEFDPKKACKLEIDENGDSCWETVKCQECKGNFQYYNYQKGQKYLKDDENGK